MRTAARAGSLLAIALTAHTAWNLRHLASLEDAAPRADVSEKVSILIPARNEEQHIERTVRSALDQQGLTEFEVIVLDDGSTDGTAEILRSIHDDRLKVLHGKDSPPPAGWLGKPYACARLSAHATGSVIVFVDADVDLAPHAISSAIGLLRTREFDLVAPYPRLIAKGWFERLVQPLVVWSWASTVPLAWAESSQRASLSAANGQLLVFDARAYRGIEGHRAVADNVLEDIALMRAVRMAGGRAITVDGSRIADCRMYSGTQEVIDGYSKSLWAAFGGPVGSAAVVALLSTAYVLPVTSMITARNGRDRAWGAAGFLAGVTGRALVAQRTGSRVLPDSLAQPASIAAFAGMNALSWWRHRRGTNSWKGRAVTTEASG
jgi:cellulose synthase/poly-beta-1,6-N-acetylglucosamine synthase-like glycosyltransferase